MDKFVRNISRIKDKVTKSTFERQQHSTTSDEPTFPPQEDQEEVARHTYYQTEYQMIFDHLCNKLTTSETKKWRKVIKGLQLLEVIYDKGNKRFRIDMKNQVAQLKALEIFEFHEQSQDRGKPIKALAKKLHKRTVGNEETRVEEFKPQESDSKPEDSKGVKDGRPSQKLAKQKTNKDGYTKYTEKEAEFIKESIMISEEQKKLEEEEKRLEKAELKRTVQESLRTQKEQQGEDRDKKELLKSNFGGGFQDFGGQEEKPTKFSPNKNSVKVDHYKKGDGKIKPKKLGPGFLTFEWDESGDKKNNNQANSDFGEWSNNEKNADFGNWNNQPKAQKAQDFGNWDNQPKAQKAQSDFGTGWGGTKLQNPNSDFGDFDNFDGNNKSGDENLYKFTSGGRVNDDYNTGSRDQVIANKEDMYNAYGSKKTKNRAKENEFEWGNSNNDFSKDPQQQNIYSGFDDFDTKGNNNKPKDDFGTGFLNNNVDFGNAGGFAESRTCPKQQPKKKGDEGFFAFSNNYVQQSTNSPQGNPNSNPNSVGTGGQFFQHQQKSPVTPENQKSAFDDFGGQSNQFAPIQNQVPQQKEANFETNQMWGNSNVISGTNTQIKNQWDSMQFNASVQPQQTNQHENWGFGDQSHVINSTQSNTWEKSPRKVYSEDVTLNIVNNLSVPNPFESQFLTQEAMLSPALSKQSYQAYQGPQETDDLIQQFCV